MEGRYGIYIMHRHRHNPVRATSSRDPCLDHPASRGRTATTQPVVVTPPAVPAGNTLLPSPYTGTIKVERHLGAGTDWMAGLKKVDASPQEAPRLGLSGMVSGPQRRPLAVLEESPDPGRRSR